MSPSQHLPSALGATALVLATAACLPEDFPVDPSASATATDSTTGSATTTTAGPEATTDLPTTTAPLETSTGVPPPACEPGQTQCADEGSVQVCGPDGEFGPPQACAPKEQCGTVDSLGIDEECAPACDLVWSTDEWTNLGCSFRLFPVTGGDQARVVAVNPWPWPTPVALLWTDEGVTLAAGPVVVPPGGEGALPLPSGTGDGSLVAPGAALDLVSALPVAAVVLVESAARGGPVEAALALPDQLLGSRTYAPGWWSPAEPAAVLETSPLQGTTLAVHPTVGVAAGPGVPLLGAGEPGALQVPADALVRLAAGDAGDPTGSALQADGALAFSASVPCAEVPLGVGTCGRLLEYPWPTSLWGLTTVAVPAPARGGKEVFRWRVVAGEPAEMFVDVQPAMPDVGGWMTPGEYDDLAALSGGFLVQTVNEQSKFGRVLVVQVLEGATTAGSGAPAEVQVVPVERWLSRYAVTAAQVGDVDHHVLQVLRPAGGEPVEVDGLLVGGWSEPLPGWEVADVEVGPGPHRVFSTARFGLHVFGYGPSTAYAYPGGIGRMPADP